MSKKNPKSLLYKLQPKEIVVLLTTKDIATILKISPRTVHTLTYRGQLKRGPNQLDNMLTLLSLMLKRRLISLKESEFKFALVRNE
jgi:hypothetical protein